MSTATLAIRQEESVQNQMRALADRIVFDDESLDQPTAIRSPALNKWIAMFYAHANFSDLIPQYVVPRNTCDFLLFDESDLADHWRVLSHGPRQLLELKEEELLDWDITIKTPSTRSSTTILASVEYRGRAKPRPVVEPWD